MSDPAPADEALPEPRPAPPKRSRITRILVLAGALGAAALVLPRVPRDREIELRVEDPATIVAIDVAWSRDDGEPVRGGSWRFTPGQAPRSLTTSVHVPSGRYALDVTVQRIEGRDELHRVIDLSDADHVTVPLR